MRQFSACLVAAALAGAGAVAPAHAADDMGSNPITELFDAFGMGDKEKPEIDYRERPPLVPPSSTSNLPAPLPKGSVAAQSTGQWPTDPDEERRAQRRAEANKLPTETYNYRMNQNPRLMPSELAGGRVEGAGRPDPYTRGTSADNDSPVLSPQQLRESHNNAQNALAASRADTAGEPQRRRLTDPPVGYRTGSPNAPAPVAEAASDKPWYRRMNPFSSN